MENSEVVSDELLARHLPLSALVAKLLEMIDAGSMEAETSCESIRNTERSTE